MANVAIVTGASRGLGYTIAGKLNQDGWNLGVCAREAPDIKGLTTLNSIRAGLDVSHLSHVRQFIQKVNYTFGKIDVLINNAAYCHPLKDIEDITIREAKETVETNILGPFYFIHEIIPYMKIQKHGLIINIGSRSGNHPNSGLSLYSASKGALIVLSDAVSKQLDGTNIHCKSISPGPMKTKMREDIVGDSIEQPDPSEIASVVIGMIRGEF